MATIGISSWSVRHLLGPIYRGLALDPAARSVVDTYGMGALALLDLPAAMQAQGYATLDLCHFHLPRTDPDYLHVLRTRLDDAGVTLLTFLIDDGDLSHPDPAVRERDLADTAQWLPIAAQLGAKLVRVAAGDAQADATDPAIQQSAAGLRTLATVAQQHGLNLITETWRPLALPPENLRAILAATGNQVGHCADFNNYQSYGARKYAALQAVLPGAVTVHAGAQFDRAGNLDEADFRQSMALARAANFTGPYVLIYSGPDDEWAGLAQLAALVREALAA